MKKSAQKTQHAQIAQASPTDALLNLLQQPTLSEADELHLSGLLSALPPSQMAALGPIIDELLRRRHIERGQTDFGYYCRSVRQGGYIPGEHLRLMAKKLQDVADGKIKRLIIAMPPRHSKSEHTSILFPSYFLGRRPDAYVMAVSHTADLSTIFGRSVRDYLATPEYKDIFGNGVEMRPDVKSAGEWATTQGGRYFAVGVGGALAGRGAHLLLLDDLINEQKALEGQTRPEVYEKVYEWYLLARQRLMPGGAIVLCATRWAINDPTGLILERSKEDWEILTLPAIWPDGRILWPEFWSKDDIYAVRDEMPPLKWSATYQQQPEAGGGTLVDKSWIQDWIKPKPPKLNEIIVTIDPAFSEQSRADPTGVVVTGVFTREAEDGSDEDCVIVLDAYETRQNFPDLKTTCYELYKEWKPDTFMIEDKASGVPLAQELQAIGVPVTLYKVTRGKAGQSNDKISRLNAVLPVIQSKKLWIPMDEDWAIKLINQLTKFPMVTNDDMVDALVMALTYFRNSGVVRANLDRAADPEDDETEYEFGGYGSSLRN